MPFATLDGIKTHYVQKGAGPYLLMMAPRAFDSTLQSWEHGKWNDMNAIGTLSEHFTVIAYDRREAGQSGGRVEPLTWKVYARQAKLLLEHLAVERAFVLGVWGRRCRRCHETRGRYCGSSPCGLRTQCFLDTNCEGALLNQDHACGAARLAHNRSTELKTTPVKNKGSKRDGRCRSRR